MDCQSEGRDGISSGMNRPPSGARPLRTTSSKESCATGSQRKPQCINMYRYIVFVVGSTYVVRTAASAEIALRGTVRCHSCPIARRRSLLCLNDPTSPFDCFDVKTLAIDSPAMVGLRHTSGFESNLTLFLYSYSMMDSTLAET